MTTTVKVGVPSSANWDAVVLIEDKLQFSEPVWKVTQVEYVTPGSEREFYSTSTRRITVMEHAHDKR